eukprot:Rmarinus@m.24948
MSTEGRAEQFIAKAWKIFEEHGNDDYIGEAVSQETHALQAARCAELEDENDDELVIAALFHDIGHLCAPAEAEKMDDVGIMHHESIGAKLLLDAGFSQRVADLVEAHVAAKRYLTFKDESYYNKLSDASKKTLMFQGGKMTKEEAVAYENDKDFKLFIKMREFDEAAKKVDWVVPGLDHYRPRIERLLS